MCLCVAVDGAQFEDPQGQDFEDVPEQQQFVEEGKWSLIIFLSYSNAFTYMHACVYKLMGPKLRICLV
jgi:hypothetical protein